jgi:hypothetical protein
MVINARPSVMHATDGDIMAGTRTIKGNGKWCGIMDDQYAN